MESFVKIRNTTNYFIHKDGYVFKTGLRKEKRLTPYWNISGSELYVSIDNSQKNLLYLMVEYFNFIYKQSDCLNFKATKDLRIPFDAIFITKIDDDVTDDDKRLFVQYKCNEKASSANSRCKDKITPLQILHVLKINKFKCIYCGLVINSKNWHLDHYYPVSKSGKNVIANLVSSCSVCNLMKSNMTGEQFYRKCEAVINNFAHKEMLRQKIL